ncbi:MAG: hypothetical protein AAGC79_18265 [Pseudomonadota bacterium]
MADSSISASNQLTDKVKYRQAQIDEIAETLTEATSISWLWAFLCGPLYFAFHGFWGRAVLILCLNFLLIGFIIAPFLAYPAWRERAKERAERMLIIEGAS